MNTIQVPTTLGLALARAALEHKVVNPQHGKKVDHWVARRVAMNMEDDKKALGTKRIPAINVKLSHRTAQELQRAGTPTVF